MSKRVNNLINRVIIIIVITAPFSSFARNFFEERYRGWLWLEEKERAELQNRTAEELASEQLKKEQYAQARKEVEQFAQELEELRYMMIRYPDSIEHARAYKKKELIMMDNAIKLAATSRMVNFIYPEQVNLIDNPINLYGRRIKEEIDSKGNSEKIKQLAGEIELFVFFSSSCPYCVSLEPVLNDFAKTYGFKVEAVSLDGSQSKYFKTHQDAGLAESLGLQRSPTIVAVTNDSSARFELIRGMASISELEDACLMAIKYLKIQQKQGSGNEQ
jgi:conjugal transfer pilus assembly protein TraF